MTPLWSRRLANLSGIIGLIAGSGLVLVCGLRLVLGV